MRRAFILWQVVLAILIVGDFFGDRVLDDRIRRLSEARTRNRLRIESVTDVRRDARKTYVTLLEANAGILRDPTDRDTTAVIHLVSEVTRFGTCATCDREEQRLTADVVQSVLAWCTALQTVPAAVDHLALERMQGMFSEIDRLVDRVLVLNSSAARGADEHASDALALQSRVRLAGMGLLLAFLASAAIYGMRALAQKRLAAAARAQRDQQEVQAALELRVAERTQQLQEATQAIADQMNQRLKIEVDLRQAQKLEAVGRLAAGIAHEINTPIQFVGDSIHFLRGAFDDAAPLLKTCTSTAQEISNGGVAPATLDQLRRNVEDADLDYLLTNVPKAFDRSVDGLQRVATLVRSMKEFAHPDQKEKAKADLNHALSTTLTIARNEYKYVADVETHFGELPPVLCHVNELNQAFLNIIVNASHAIGDVVKGTEQRGKIVITTRAEGDEAVISIADTGGGIPEDIRDKIFEPFFTTKEVGKGTGQGLAIARTAVVDKHGGALTFRSEMGKGTTFEIRLKVEGVQKAPAPEQAAA